MIQDTFNRHHNYLRISLTDRCNFRCFYCMPNEDYNFSPSHHLMQAEEVKQLADIFVAEGVRKIRLTGGEPLVRKDAFKIIAYLATLPVHLTMTTNGWFLDRFVNLFEQTGLSHINISLDTLQSDKFQLMTRRNAFQKVMDNIQLCLHKGFHIKINVVLMKGVNDDEIMDFIAWTKTTPIHIRFIEFMPFKDNQWVGNKVISWQEVLSQIAQHYVFEPLQADVHDTAKPYQVKGYKGTFAMITTMSAPFCHSCNRMRLTADGKLKNCLFSKGETDLLTPLRRGENIIPLIYQTMRNKAKALGGQWQQDYHTLDASYIDNRSMIGIGG